MQDLGASEVLAAPVAYANAVADLCERWAVAEGQQTRFLACWSVGARVLASHQWTCGDGRPALDGSSLSQIAQAQQHAEVQHRLHHEGQSLLTDGWKALLGLAMDRVKAVEKENAELRERLKRSDDVDATIAVSSAEADLETRARTAAILEERVLPIFEALATRALTQHLSGATATAPTAEQQQHSAATEHKPS